MKFSLERIRKEFDKYDSKREKVIQSSRVIIRKSKNAIGCVHRDEMSQAFKHINEMKKDIVELKKIAKDKLRYEGIFKVAIQEYVEAFALYTFMKSGKIITYNEEFVEHDYYLLGLCDLGGEFVRKAINSSINDKPEIALKIRDALGQLYIEMGKFDFRNGEVRKKYDGIKYDLKKLDDLAFQLKMKDKI